MIIMYHLINYLVYGYISLRMLQYVKDEIPFNYQDYVYIFLIGFRRALNRKDCYVIDGIRKCKKYFTSSFMINLNHISLVFSRNKI